ncbi:hypothetical protein OAO87_04040, partial [bacterium]|nr:hypothetical protein [bacterium]
MSEPSAHKHSDKDWRKAVAEVKRKASGSSINRDGKAASGRSDLAERLARAREKRERAAVDVDVSDAPGGGSSGSDPDGGGSAVGATERSPRARERAASAVQRAYRRRPTRAGCRASPAAETPEEFASPVAAVSPPPAASAASASAAAGASTTAAEEGSETGGTEAMTEWWFTRADGAVAGPFTNHQMRTRYAKVRHVTRMRRGRSKP